MTQPHEEVNPFRAPESMSPDIGTLADDAEFLFSSSEILCRDKVELPKACICLGETDSLVRRQKTLRIISGVGLIGVIICPVMFLILVTNFGGRGAVVMLLAIVVSKVIYSSALKSRLPWTHAVDATWYVSERYLARVKWQNRIGRILIIGVSGFVGWALGADSITLTEQIGIILSALTVGILVGFGLRTERKLALRGRRLIGRHRGLMVLTGHSRRFAEVAERYSGGF